MGFRLLGVIDDAANHQSSPVRPAKIPRLHSSMEDATVRQVGLRPLNGQPALSLSQ